MRLNIIVMFLLGPPNVTIDVPVSSVTSVHACFSPKVFLLCFQLSPSQCRPIQQSLAMDRSKGMWMDPECPDETMKRLTVFPDEGTMRKKKIEELNSFTESVFGERLVVLDTKTANDLLKKTAPKVKNMVGQASRTASTRASSSTTAKSDSNSETAKASATSKPSPSGSSNVAVLKAAKTSVSESGPSSDQGSSSSVPKRGEKSKCQAAPSSNKRHTAKTANSPKKKKTESDTDSSSRDSGSTAKATKKQKEDSVSQACQAGPSKSKHTAKTSIGQKLKSLASTFSKKSSSKMSKKAAKAMTEKAELSCKVCKTFKTRHIQMLAKHIEEKHPGAKSK